MAFCVDCEKDMLVVDSCVVDTFHRGPLAYPLVRFGAERPRWKGARCGDCNVRRSGLHHPGCDVAQCPACRGQQISCGCVFDEWGEKESDDEPDVSDEMRIARTVQAAVAWTAWRTFDVG